MVSPDPDETLVPSGTATPRPAQERIDLPVYKPRGRFGRGFWLAFGIGLGIGVAVVLLLI
jgi:hypothetical protein